MNELKPCPFCGGDAKIVDVEDLKGFFALCKHCNASTRIFYSEEVAIEAWNRRVDNG